MTIPRDEPETATAVRLFTALASQLHARGHEPREVVRLRDRLVVCMFVAQAGLLPAAAIEGLIDGSGAPAGLFRAVMQRGWFDGSLFAESRALPLEAGDLRLLQEAAQLDWGAVEPGILGTLFERELEPARRSQLGAHYTDHEAVTRILEPVVLAPLRREYSVMQAAAGQGRAADARAGFHAFLARLRGVRVLDPSCGAGNFLYRALWALQELEREVLAWGARRLEAGLEPPQLGSTAVHGIERNPEAAELARLTLWIAEVSRRNTYDRGTPVPSMPRTIACRDAILELSADGVPRRPVWPDAEFIIGNPPFLGGKKLRAELGDRYVEQLFAAWAGRVPRQADLVAYWHEAAREAIARGQCKRAALLATQGIRGGANLEVLRRIKASGDIFMAWSDAPWVAQGAAVRVSMVAQDDGSETRRSLDGIAVAVIHADLTGGRIGAPDVTRARRLHENRGVAFMGDTKGGKFDLSPEQAAALLAAPGPPGRPNSDVVVPWVNGLDVTRRPRGKHIIDFGVDMPEATAAQYIEPFAYLRERVAPVRATNRREAYRDRWWIHVEPRPALRAAIRPLARFIATPTVARHRVFVWLTSPTLPDHQLIVIAREDDYCLGVLHSRIHELWSLRMCTWLGAGNDPRYTPTTTFETFPFPWPLDTPEGHLTPAQRRHSAAIAAAAAALHAARQRWQCPAEPTQPGLAVDAAREPGRRTLTALYHARPDWLVAAHAALDRTVAAAYGWPDDLDDDALLVALLACNHERPAR